MPKKKKDLEKVLPALAALAGGAARGIAGGAIRSGIASAASGIGGDDSDSPIQQSVKKIHKAEPELHPDVNDAMRRLGTLPTRSKSEYAGGATASDMAEEMGADISKPTAQAKFPQTPEGHPEGAGVPTIDGYTEDEWKEFGMNPPSRGGGERTPKGTAKSHSIEQSLLKLMKGHFPGTPLDDDDWKKLNELKQKEERFGEEHQPSIPTINGDTSKITKGGSFPERGSRQQVENRGNLPSMGSPWGARENKARQEASQQKLIEGLLSRRQSKSVEKTDAEIDVAPDIKFRPAPKTHPEYDRIPTEEDPRTYSSPSDVSTPEAEPYEQQQEREDVIRDSSSRGGRKGGTRGVRSGFSEEVPDYSRHRSGPPETRKRSYLTSAIENSLLKLMKGEDPRQLPLIQGRLKSAPEEDTPESEITQGKLPLSEAEVRNLGNPDRPFQRGWDTGKTYQTSTPGIPGPARKGERPGVWERMSPERQAEHPKGIPSRRAVGHVTINERAKAIEDSLLKLMKAPPQPGTPPGAPVKPNKPTVATPGASGGGIPGGAAGAPGGAATTAPQANPQTNPYTTPTEHAKRSIQASMEKVDFSDTKPEGDIKHPIDMPNGDKVFQKPIQIRRREPSERTGPPIKITRREPTTPDPITIRRRTPTSLEESLLKLMKAPTDLTSQRRQAHITNVGKTSQTSREAGAGGRELLQRQDLNVQPGDTGAGEAHALASTTANLLGARAAQDFYSKLGQQSPQEFADTGGSRSRANPSIDGTDANVPPNPQPPAQQAAPQGAVNAGETATPTPDTNTPPPFKPQHIGANLLGGKKPS